MAHIQILINKLLILQQPGKRDKVFFSMFSPNCMQDPIMERSIGVCKIHHNLDEWKKDVIKMC
ncbi:hypothetical protein L103_01642 [Lactiplantibacillus plantarum IPLA88]|nr:hypothetical protein L103_01642 [Lactiplantibacillus plantarum IPLA88]